MKVALASDERTSLTEFLIRELEQCNHEVLRFGSIADGDTETDWPQSSRNAAQAVARGDAQEAIMCCWTGTGASIAANKVAGVARRFVPMLQPPRARASGIMPMCSRSACDRLQRLSRWKFSTCGSTRLMPQTSGTGSKSRESRMRTMFAPRRNSIRGLNPSPVKVDTPKRLVITTHA